MKINYNWYIVICVMLGIVQGIITAFYFQRRNYTNDSIWSLPLTIGIGFTALFIVDKYYFWRSIHYIEEIKKLGDKK